MKKKQTPAPSSSAAAAHVGAFQPLQLHVPDGHRRVMSVGRIEMPPISFHKLDFTSTSPSPQPPPQPSPHPHQHLHQPDLLSVKCYLRPEEDPQCDETFAIQSDLMTHMSEEHGGNLCVGCEQFGCRKPYLNKPPHCWCKLCVTKLQSYLFGTTCHHWAE